MSDGGEHEFNPDWTIAPAAMLRLWMAEKIGSMHLSTFAFICAGRDGNRDEALALIGEVLDRKPLTEAHASLLARGTSVPAPFWLALENGYRNDLAAGRTGTTPEEGSRP